ncbi:acyl carrier protein [Luteimonas sp. e5]
MNESPTNDPLVQAFASVLGLPASDITNDLKYATIPQWDSIAHMSIIAALEEAFGIMIDMEDVIDMNTVGMARNIVAKYLS